jgi:hypothetical protein
VDGVPRPHGRIVELVNLPSRFEADLVIARLDEVGIQAMAKYGDADGMAPSIGLLDGYRVCVFDDDLDAAKAFVEAPIDEPPVDEPPM